MTFFAPVFAFFASFLPSCLPSWRGRPAMRPRPAVLVALALCCAATLAQTPSDRERTDAAAKRTADRLRALQREADALAAQERTLLVDLRKLEVQRQIAVEHLAGVGRDLAATQKKIEGAEARAALLARTAQAQLPDIEARLVQLYKMGRAGYWRLLLNVEDLQALGRAYRTAATLNAIDRARVMEYYATLDALALERKSLHARAAELEALKVEAVRARTALDRAVDARTALVDSIDERRDLNAQLVSELEAAQQKLQASLSQIAGGGTGSAGPALPLRPFQGDLPWPARGAILTRFGRQPSSRFGTAIVRNGMEIELTEGQLVRSVHEGTVAYADQFAGYGNLVILEHGNRAYSLYGYLAAIAVTRGQHVDTGTAVGTSGVDPEGNPALYFELRVDGTAVDPLQWLRR